MTLHNFLPDDESQEHFEKMLLIRCLAFATLLKVTRELGELGLIEICAGDIHIRASHKAIDKLQAQLLSYNHEIRFSPPDSPDESSESGEK